MTENTEESAGLSNGKPLLLTHNTDDSARCPLFLWTPRSLLLLSLAGPHANRRLEGKSEESQHLPNPGYLPGAVLSAAALATGGVRHRHRTQEPCAVGITLPYSHRNRV